MLSPKENVLAILNGEKPDYILDFMDATEVLPDPVFLSGLVPNDGKEYRDPWGTTICWLPGSPGQHPHVTDENKVIKDIEEWRNQVKIPSLDGLDWSVAVEMKKKMNAGEKFSMVFCSTGIFERSHFLMGMEDAFCNYLEYPEEMTELLSAIADYKIEYIHRAAEILQPEMIFYQDDWGSKQNLFLPPATWREIIKPIQMRIANAIRECGMMYVHHCDCYATPIAQDMVDLGVQIWQGVIPENDILGIQKELDDALPMQGGIDVPAIDAEGMPEDKVRAEVRRAFDTYCEKGRFFPGFPGGFCADKRVDSIARDEIEKYGRLYVQERYA